MSGALISHTPGVQKDMVDRSVTDSAAMGMAKREEQLLDEKSVNDVYES